MFSPSEVTEAQSWRLQEQRRDSDWPQVSRESVAEAGPALPDSFLDVLAQASWMREGGEAESVQMDAGPLSALTLLTQPRLAGCSMTWDTRPSSDL